MTLRAAVLARRSTAHQETSIERQIADARAFAEKRGWSIESRHIFFVDDVSGAVTDRRDLEQLLDATKSIPRPFDVLIIEVEDRLSRVMWRQLALLVDLHEAGLRVFRYSDGREVLSETSDQKLTLAIRAYLSEAEREQIVRRTRAASHYRGRNGWVAGGKLYGYDNVRLGEGSTSHVERRINKDEAEVVRRVFRRSAEGAGLRRIAKELNEDGIASPRAGRRGTGTWASSAIRSMLFNPSYVGRIVFGKKRRGIRGGKKVTLNVPEQDWIRLDAPDLRIIDDKSWAAVRSRFDRNPSFGGAGRAPRGLLTGNLRCGTCGARVYVVGGAGGMGERVYGCGRRHEGGASTCGNKAKRPTPNLDRLVAREIQAMLAARDVMDVIVEKAAGLHEAGKGREVSALARAERELQEATRRRGNFVKAIGDLADPELMAPLLESMKTAEAEVKRLKPHVARLRGAARSPDPAETIFREKLRKKLEDLPALLTADVGRGRDILRALLVEPLRAHPIRDGGEDRWLISGNLAAVGLFQDCGDPNGI
jgi:site-specific DNA recombinase